MSKREKTLAFLVGGVVFLLINVFVINFFLNKRGDMLRSTAVTQVEIDKLRKLDSQRAWWSERDKWLSQTQPVMEDAQVSQKKLSDLIKEVARKNDVTLETPQPGNPNKSSKDYISLPVSIVVKGTWKAVFNFVQELQHPEKFIVLDPLEMSVDVTDKTLMRAKITVSRWFKPM